MRATLEAASAGVNNGVNKRRSIGLAQSLKSDRLAKTCQIRTMA